MTFRVGQKVVCIKDGDWNVSFPDDYAVSLPRKGEVYTIRAIGADWAQYGESAGITLQEIRNPPDPFYSMGEVGFLAGRFRPVIEWKTDISTFTDILDGVNKHNRVPA